MRFRHAKFVCLATSGRLIRRSDEESDEESDVVESRPQFSYVMYIHT